MGVKTPPLSSRMRGPIFPPLPQVPFRGPANNLVAPAQRPSIPLLCAIPITQRAPFPRRGVPRGRPSPHPTHCRAPSYTFPCHSEAPRGTSPAHAQRPSIPLLCAIPITQRTPLPPHGLPPWAPLRGKVRMGVKTPPLSSRMRGPIFPPLPPNAIPRPREQSRRPRSTPLHPITVRHSHHPTRPFPHMTVPRGPPSPHPTPCDDHPVPSPVIPRLREESPHPTLNTPPSHYCAPFPPPTALLFPHMAVPRGRPPPILPIAAHHPIPSPVIPRLREEPHHPTLNTPPSHYCAPFPPPTALLFPHMAVPRGRPPPILPIAAHHPIPSPVIPRLREEPHHPTLNTPPSHYCAPFPPPNALPLSP